MVEGGPECGQPLEAAKDKEMNSSFEPPERKAALLTPDVSPGDPCWTSKERYICVVLSH